MVDIISTIMIIVFIWGTGSILDSKLDKIKEEIKKLKSEQDEKRN
jgi:hypothetical protein